MEGGQEEEQEEAGEEEEEEGGLTLHFTFSVMSFQRPSQSGIFFPLSRKATAVVLSVMTNWRLTPVSPWGLGEGGMDGQSP